MSIRSQAEKKGTVLVLYSKEIKGRKYWRPAELINPDGEQNELICLDRRSETEAYFSCSVNWKNQLHVFGGSANKRQISRLNGYRLERIGSLTFDHYWGACSVMASQYIFLCFNFDSKDTKRCRRSTEPNGTFTEVALSKHDHRYTQISCSESKSINKSLNHTADIGSFCHKFGTPKWQKDPTLL